MFLAFFVLGLHLLIAQTVQITGTVTSKEDGQPLPGASVLVKGTTVGTTTDFNGKYSLSIPSDAQTLVISFVGMKQIEVAVAGQTVINAGLESETVGLEEVVVTALGMKRAEKSLGYAATSVKGDEANAARSASVMSGLQGKVAGLTVSAAGSTGTSQKVFIRGISSFTGSNQPLYVINGVPMSNNFSGIKETNNSVDFGNQADDINPDDIESITVLKSASSTALYGSRAANGVIMITTKRGSNTGKISVTLNSSVTASSILRVPQTQKSFGQGWPYWDAAENGSWGPDLDGRNHQWGAYTSDFTATLDPPSIYSDYNKMEKPFSYVKNGVRDFYETGWEYQNTLTVSGGNEKNTFAMSYGNTYSDGVIPTKADLFKRNIVSFRGNHTDGKFKAEFDISYVRKDIKAVSAGQGSNGAALFQELVQMPVDIPITSFKDYNSIYNNTDNFFTLYAENPYWVIAKNGNTYQDDRVYGKVELSYQLIPSTKVVGRIGGDFANSRQTNYNSAFTITPGAWSDFGKNPEPGTYQEVNDYNGQIDASGLLIGEYKLSTDFKLNAVAGLNYNTRNSYNSTAFLYGLQIPDWFSLSNGADKPVTTSLTSKRVLIGALGEFNFSFKDWAFLTTSLRNDWSSTLPKSKNSYFYYGLNASVILTDALPALKEGNILSFVKIRGAYGKTGNDAAPYRVFNRNLPTNVGLGFGSLNSPIGGVLGMTLSNLAGNSNLKPEITTDMEIGMDLRFFKNRIGLDFSYYAKSTKDQIISSSVAPETAFTTYTRNVGQVDNKGFEIALTVVPVQTKSFQWEFITNFSKNKSKVVKLWDNVKEYNIFSSYGVDFVAEVGQPFGVFKVPLAAKTDDGKIIVNTAGRPTVDPVNKKVVGSHEPDFILGFNNRFTFKGITLTMLVDYRQGGKFWSNTAEMLAFNGNSTITTYNDRHPFIVPNSVKVVKNPATGVNEYMENDIPILRDAMYSYYNHSTNTLMYENFVLNKTYVKLRELTLSYALPKKILGNGFVKGLEFGVIGRNLLMWTPESNNFVDPEATNYGNDLQSEFGEFTAAPTSRYFGGNVKITF